MLNSEEIIAAIHGSYATGSKNGFQNVLTLLDKMHVALRTPIVHVAGTNGKGSTCAMLESVLRRAGYHTGLYTSPFLQAYQERIRLGGLPLDDARMVKYGNPLVQAAVLFYAVTYVLLNFVADILYTVLNPRVKL